MSVTGERQAMAVVELIAGVGYAIHELWPLVEGTDSLGDGRLVAATTSELLAALVASDPPRAAELADRLDRLRGEL